MQTHILTSMLQIGMMLQLSHVSDHSALWLLRMENSDWQSLLSPLHIQHALECHGWGGAGALRSWLWNVLNAGTEVSQAAGRIPTVLTRFYHSL